MKLLLSWLFDHIDADWKTIDVAKLVNLFNRTTAEIEGFEKINVDTKKLAAGTVASVAGQTVSVEIPELKKSVNLPVREGVAKGQIYLLAQEGKDFVWAKLSHVGSQKEGLLAAINISEKELAGAWKKNIPEHDYVLHLDNKSVNHRPDMWGHRGVAREVAAMLNLPFKALDHMLDGHDVQAYEKKAATNKEHSFSVAVENPEACKKFSGLYISKIEATASVAWMAFRLAQVDSRPINAIVDTTNYVMLDLGQPMHAFDAGKLSDKAIVVRNAKNKETMTVLDGQSVELTSQDCLITDGKKPIALAGIIGGKESCVDSATTAIFLESANFDATVIRKTAARVKKRTDASARFEKSLDPAQTEVAIERFLKLLDDAGIAYTTDDVIMSIVAKPLESFDTLRTSGSKPARGEPVEPVVRVIQISHAFIEQLLGVPIDQKLVVQILQKLEFGVDVKKDTYHITVPTFRATKDVAIKQDIVEEIARFYGYDTIAQHLPERQTKPFDLTGVMRTRRIKQLLAYALDMRELYTYAFFDESFLQQIDWDPGKTLQVQEAVSQNYQRLVTTLVPNLCKAVHVHADEYDQMRFFEWAKIWEHEEGAFAEYASLSGILVDQKKPVDFYEAKQKLCKLARLLGLHFDWVKADINDLQPWYLPYQTAYIMCEGKKIGTAGKVHPEFFAKIANGDAFIFELDANFLLSVHVPVKRYLPASKYPSITRDVSMMVPTMLTVHELRTALKNIDSKITQVDLFDFFQKPEWKDQKSLTFRITFNDPNATMTNEQADVIMKHVTAYLQKQGATIR